MAHLRSYWTTQVECFPILVLVEEPAPPWVIKTTAGPESGPSESLECDESWRHPKPKPPFFTDGDRVHMRGSKYVLELFLGEDRWHQVRAGASLLVPRLRPHEIPQRPQHRRNEALLPGEAEHRRRSLVGATGMGERARGR